MANTVSRILSDETLNRIIQIESAGKPTAHAPTSSAQGLGQFINGTWLAELKKHRADLFNGPPYDDELALERDPGLQIEILARFTEDNAAALGHGWTDGDLYLAHFLGVGTAKAFLRASSGATASKLAGAAAVKANHSILADKTVGQVRAWAQQSMVNRWDRAGRPDWVKKYAGPGAIRPPVAPVEPEPEPLPEPPPPVAPPPDPAVQGDPELWHVQRRLKAMNYNPGGTDGKWGGLTAGAISGFMNDREMTDGAPTSLDMFNGVREGLKAEIGRAESEGFTRPISAARANADQTTVAEKAPEVVPVKRNFLAAAWASASAFFIGLWNAISDHVAAAWSFFTDHKDDLPDGAASSIWDWFGQVPGYVWLILVAVGLGFIAWNSHKGIQRITQAVQSGERA